MSDPNKFPSLTGRHVSPESQRLGYDNEIRELSTYSNKISLKEISESLKGNGAYLELVNVIGRVEFQENFASYLAENLRGVISGIKDLEGPADIRDLNRQIISNIDSTLLPLCDASNDPGDVIDTIMQFIETEVSGRTLTGVIANEIESAALDAIVDAYGNIHGQIEKNSYAFLDNLADTDKAEVNKLLAAMGYGKLESLSSNTELLDTLAAVVSIVGISELGNVQTSIVNMFAEKSTEAAKQKQQAQLGLEKIKNLVERISSTDASGQTALISTLNLEVARYNAQWGLTAGNEIDASKLLVDNDAQFDSSKLTVAAVLELPYSLAQAESTWRHFNLILTSLAPIDSAAFDKAYAELSAQMGSKYQLLDKDRFVDTETELKDKSSKPSIWEVLGLTPVPNAYADLEQAILPSTEPEWPKHLAKLKKDYNLDLSYEQLTTTDNSGQRAYEPAQIDVPALLGIAGGNNFASFEQAYKKVQAATDMTAAEAQLTELNKYLVNGKHKQVTDFYDVTTTYTQKALAPTNVFEAMGIAGIDDSNGLAKALAPGTGVDPLQFCSELQTKHGIRLDANDIVSVHGQKVENPAEIQTMMQKIEQVSLPKQANVSLTTQQACMALRAVTIQQTASQLPEPVKLSNDLAMKAGVISMVQNSIRSKIDKVRAPFGVSSVNAQEIRESGDKQRISRLKTEMYETTFTEIMHAIALDFSTTQASYNQKLQVALDGLARGFDRATFESVMSQFQPALVLKICAELNSFTTGNRAKSDTDNRKVIYQSAEDVALVNRFTNYAMDLVQNSYANDIVNQAHVEFRDGMTQMDKLQILTNYQTQKNNVMSNITSEAFHGSNAPVQYRFQPEVRDALNQRRLQKGWSLNDSDSQREIALASSRDSRDWGKARALAAVGGVKSWRTAARGTSGLWSAAKWLVNPTKYQTAASYIGSGLGYVASAPFRLAGATIALPFRTIGYFGSKFRQGLGI